jgi:uncharacterized cupin superfamily protein
MGKIDPAKVTVRRGSRYPAPHDEPCRAREALLLSDAAGLTQFGAVLMRLDPGAWSSQRHWHAHEDEFVHVLEGELVLVTDAGEEIMRRGDSAGFRAGVRDGHHLQNRSDSVAVFLAVGARDDSDWGEYSDIDMKWGPGRYRAGGAYARKDGSPV